MADYAALQPTQITDAELDGIIGAANLDFAAIRQRAQSYCPTTVARREPRRGGLP
jgi:hypothetical protein